MKSPSRKSSITNASAVADTKTEESYDWRENLIKMREQIKAVQDLPKIHVPEPIKYQKFTSSSTPNLSQFSDKPKWSCESSWEIRAKYRSMRTEELYQSQLIKKSGYSWRDKVPEIQKSLKFTEVRSNVVTDVAFIGSSYVRQKNSSNEKVDKSKNPQVMMSKSYGIDSSINIFELVIKDNLPHDTRKAMKYVKLATYSIEDVNQDSKFLERLWQMIKFFSLCWQLKLCHPGFDLSGDVAKIIAAAKVMETIMEVDETPDLEECKKAELDITGGDIKTKMTGAIAGLQLVKKKAPTDKPKQPMKVESKISSGGTSGDWRSEIKKRERAKQQEKLNAMPLGMPDYREPEKLQVVDWREKLKKEAADDNPMNKWKKFDNGVKKTVRPPPQKPKPKPSKVPKEDPCTCNVGNCKVHSKFVLKALKSTSKKTVVAPEPKSEEPVLKRKPSVKKKVESNQQPGFSKTSKTEVDNKTSKSPSEQCSRASSVVPEDEKIEVIKIINFVAIKVTTRASDAQKKRKLEDNSAQPPPPSHPPPSIPKDDSPPTKISSPSTSSMSPTPPPLPPPILFPPLALKSLSSPPIVREPSFLQVTKEIIPEPAPKPKDKSPSPVYQRKYFPNPEPMEYYKPKIHDYTPATVKLKRTEENYEDDSQVHKVQFSTSLEVTPVKFSSNKDNYVKKARFVGDSYMGDGINKFQVRYLPYELFIIHHKNLVIYLRTLCLVWFWGIPSSSRLFPGG